VFICPGIITIKGRIEVVEKTWMVEILGKIKNRIEEEFSFFWENWNFLIVMGGIVGCIGLWAFWRVCN
jgi:hypothetical protein